MKWSMRSQYLKAIQPVYIHALHPRWQLQLGREQVPIYNFLGHYISNRSIRPKYRIRKLLGTKKLAFTWSPISFPSNHLGLGSFSLCFSLLGCRGFLLWSWKLNKKNFSAFYIHISNRHYVSALWVIPFPCPDTKL